MSELVIEWRAHDGPKLDIALRLDEDANGKLPLADLYAALRFLISGGPDEFTEAVSAP